MAKRNFHAFWTSVSKEFEATRTRFQDIMGGKHNLSDGTYKELILRNAIKRHLPESLDLCTGFVCTDNECSTQIDLLMLDKEGFTLFKEGDLRIVTPGAVRAIVEVKTKMIGAKQLEEYLTKLAKNASIISRVNQTAKAPGRPLWAGMFSYLGGTGRAAQVLEFVAAAERAERYPIDCVAFGPDTLVMRNYLDAEPVSWIAFRCRHFAPGTFITSLLAGASRGLRDIDAHILFSSILHDHARPILQIKQGQATAEPFPM
jgi:hypothetical protein